MFYLILLAALPSCVVGIANPLAGLPALNKVHHSWPLDMNISDPGNAEILHDYARITHAIPAGDLEYMPQAHALAAARIAIAANATVDLLYSPWLEDDSPFPRDAPPTYTGPEEAAEIKLYAQRLAAAKQWIEVEGGAVVGAVLLDQERWDAKPNATWAAAVTRKNNLYYNTTIAAFPSASVQLYGRGGIGRGATATGWGTNGYYSLAPDELGDIFATSLYEVPEIGYTREGFNRTVANAKAHNKASVTPWIALGCGYYRDTDFWHFDLQYNYNFAYSWQLGAEVNGAWFAARPTRFAAWGWAKEVAFYPSVFDTRTANVANSSWLAGFNHFVMYVRGAAGIKDLTPVA